MEFAEALAKLGTVDGGADISAAIQAKISALNNEAATHRVKASGTAGRLENLAKAVGIDPNAEDLLAALEAVNKDRPQPGTLKALEAQVAALTKAVEAERNAKTQEAAKRRSILGRQSVLEALGKENAISPEDLAVILTPNVVVGEDDAPQWKNADGTMGSVIDGVKAWLSGKPHFIKSQQQPGPGGPRIPSTGGQDLSKLDPTERIALGLGIPKP